MKPLRLPETITMLLAWIAIVAVCAWIAGCSGVATYDATKTTTYPDGRVVVDKIYIYSSKETEVGSIDADMTNGKLTIGDLGTKGGATVERDVELFKLLRQAFGASGG